MFKKGDSVQIKIKGDLRNVKGDILQNSPSAFEIYFIFKPHSFQMSVHTKAIGTRLLFPVVPPASRSVTHTTNGELVIQKKSSRIKVSSIKTPEWDNTTGKRVFNFVPGVEAVPVENRLDDNGNCFIRIEIDKKE